MGMKRYEMSTGIMTRNPKPTAIHTMCDITLIFTIRKMARSETAVWVPLAGTVGFFAAFALSVFVAFQAVG